MEKDVMIDTAQLLNYQNRIEYRLLETQKQLQKITTSYNKWSYSPTLSGFINYGWNYQNNTLSNLYDQTFPSSVVGLKLTMPIFLGGKRTQEIKKSQLQERKIDLDLINTKNKINTQYEQAIATYKANLNDLHTNKSNVDISKQVYNTIKLQ
ncbi:TolC family protein [Pedobacter sp. NJ-S-72]